LRKAQWEELPTGKNLRQSWNVLWTWSKPHVEWQRLLVWQRVNHFPQNKNLVRKDLLRQNVYAAVKSGGTAARVFDIIPQTFVLPKDFGAFTEAFARAAQTEGIYNYWIVKPVGKS
jgi:tubulin polyglutamylase TTLL5